jgi:hypothetical protein
MPQREEVAERDYGNKAGDERTYRGVFGTMWSTFALCLNSTDIPCVFFPLGT